MDLVSRLKEDMKAAMKSGNRQRLDVIRMLLSDAQTADLRKQTAEQAVAAYAKKLSKSAEEFEKYGKPAEAATLRTELQVVQEYMPKVASEEETERLVEAFLAAGTFTEKQAGQATGQFMKSHAGAVDPGIASRLIRSKLIGK